VPQARSPREQSELLPHSQQELFAAHYPHASRRELDGERHSLHEPHHFLGRRERGSLERQSWAQPPRPLQEECETRFELQWLDCLQLLFG